MLPTRICRTRRPAWVSPLDLLHDDFDQIVGRWFGEDSGATIGAYPVDIHEDDEHVYVEAELPGFTKDQVEVTFENGVLSITAERKRDDSPKGQAHLTERRFTRVARRFALPNTVDESNIAAKLDNGVLYLTLNKREEAKAHRIEVN